MPADGSPPGGLAHTAWMVKGPRSAETPAVSSVTRSAGTPPRRNRSQLSGGPAERTSGKAPRIRSMLSMQV